MGNEIFGPFDIIVGNHVPPNEVWFVQPGPNERHQQVDADGSLWIVATQRYRIVGKIVDIGVAEGER